MRTVARILAGEGPVDRQSLEALFQALGLSLEAGDCLHPQDPAATGDPRDSPTASCVDWGEAPVVAAFHGCQQELANLSSLFMANGAAV